MFRKNFYHYLIAIITIVFFMTLTSCVSTKKGADINTPDNAPKKELVELKTRDNTTQEFILMTSYVKPKGTILLYPGGNGKLALKISSNTPKVTTPIKANFLIRISEELLSKGFNVAIIDAPSDKYGKFGMMELDNSTGKNYRMGDEQIQDAETVINYH